MEEQEMVKVQFSYTDEFGQETTVAKTLTTAVIEESSEFDMLVEQFKLFLVAAGHTQERVDTIQIVEE